jgi:homoserine dehydrogenase
MPLRNPDHAPPASPAHPHTIVLKFGSSVLADEPRLAHAVHDVYRQLRAGTRVVAVVSALGTTTDELLAHARQYADTPDPIALAALAATGEARAVALLTLALDRAGIPANALDAGAIALKARGHALDAAPSSVDRSAIERALADRPVLVVPGFVARDDLGRATLLGRGGSDFTAIYLAAALGCPCVLVKDVDALFDRDPASDPHNARRLTEASYDDVLALSEGIVQHKAVRFAKDARVRVGIARVGRDPGTVIHDGPTVPGSVGIDHEPAPLRIALLGLGAVGLGVLEALRRLPEDFQVVRAVSRSPERHRGLLPPGCVWSQDPVAAASADDCDVVIEVVGGFTPAKDAIVAALRSGKHAVTANKAVIARHADELFALALAHGVTLEYSASVGGAVPVLERVRDIARAQPIREVRGVVNGTTNFVLDCLHAGVAFDEAVLRAQRAGFAEADPSADLDGIDAAHKLSLIAREAFGQPLSIEAIATRGIRGLSPRDASTASERNATLRLVARLRRDGESLRASLAPEEVSNADPLAATVAEGNCVIIETASGTSHVLRGRGAGRYPTAEAVLADLFDIARDVRARRGTADDTLADGQLRAARAAHPFRISAGTPQGAELDA